MTGKQRVIPGVLLLLGAMFVALPGYAQEDQPTDDEVNAVAKGLYCPVCENVPLDVCPTQACRQWRDTIRDKLALGWSTEQIEDYFVAQYGDRVLASPPPRGLNWLVYVLPPIAFLAGGFILFRAMRSWQRPAPPNVRIEGDSPPKNDPYLERLEEELLRRA